MLSDFERGRDGHIYCGQKRTAATSHRLNISKRAYAYGWCCCRINSNNTCTPCCVVSRCQRAKKHVRVPQVCAHRLRKTLSMCRVWYPNDRIKRSMMYGGYPQAVSCSCWNHSQLLKQVKIMSCQSSISTSP